MQNIANENKTLQMKTKQNIAKENKTWEDEIFSKKPNSWKDDMRSQKDEIWFKKSGTSNLTLLTEKLNYQWKKLIRLFW